MKINKHQLRQIIKEEKARLHEQSRISKEVRIMADLDDIASAIEEIAMGLYGMIAPGQVGPSGAPAGDEMAGDLELQVERLNDLHQALVAHFEQQDDELGRP